MEPSLVELSPALHSKSVCCRKGWCFNSTPRTFSCADLTLQGTGALAAAEYGPLAVWTHYRLFAVLGVASTAAERCFSAGVQPRPLLVFLF